MSGTAIEVHELRKAYERRPVLRGLTFSVGSGGIFGIAGRNGAGKTTTVEIATSVDGRLLSETTIDLPTP